MSGNLTDFGALSTLRKKVYAAKVIQAGRDDSFFMGENGFMSKGLNDATKPIHYVDDLTKTERGTRCVMPLVLDLDKDGIVDDNQLEGNEEPISVDSLEIKVSQLRHAVKSRGKLSEQETVVQFRATAKDTLGFWKSEITDELCFLTASGVSYDKELDGSTRDTDSQLPQLRFNADVSAASSNRKIYAGSATSTATLTVNDKMSWNLLVRANTLAKRKRLKPIRIKGGRYYVVVMAPEQGRDLKQDNDYRTIVKDGSQRGKMNELFTGAFVVVDGLILYEHNRVYTTFGLASTSKWGASGTVDGATALLMGAQAVGYANIGDDEWGESDQKDYGNRQGISYGCMIGLIKAVFKSRYDKSGGNYTQQDFSLITIYTAAAVATS